MIRRSVGIAAIGALGAVPLARAQEALELRFAPVLGAPVHRVFQAHTRVTLPGEAEAGAARVREAAELGGVTQVAVAGPEGRPVVHLTFDSLRIRRREGSAPWREATVPELEQVWFQILLDERMRVERGVAATLAPHVPNLIELLTGAPGLVLPDWAVRRGDRWATTIAASAIGLPRSAPGTDSLEAAAVVTVDSLVARANDTLAYLSVRGGFAPRAAQGAGGASGGDVVGSLVWSTGWSTFVSGAMRIRLRVGLGGSAGAPDEEVGLLLERTVRHQVRP